MTKKLTLQIKPLQHDESHKEQEFEQNKYLEMGFSGLNPILTNIALKIIAEGLRQDSPEATSGDVRKDNVKTTRLVCDAKLNPQ